MSTMTNKISAQMRKSRKRFSKNWQLLALCLPALIGYIIFSYVPMFGQVMAFKDYRIADGIWGSAWAGLKNFKFVFRSADLFRITRNTVGYSLLFMVVSIVVNITIALLAFELDNKKALKVFQSVIQFPRFVSWVIVGFITYALLDPVRGVLAHALTGTQYAGFDAYTQPGVWPFILTLCNSWKGVGGGSLMYYAVLIGIDAELFEAASLDGASRWKQILHISIPHLIPLVCLTVILDIGGIFSGDFGLFYNIPRDVPQLYETTDIINTYIYRGLASGSYAMSSAVGFLQSVIGMIMLVVTNGIVRKVSPENSMF